MNEKRKRMFLRGGIIVGLLVFAFISYNYRQQSIQAELDGIYRDFKVSWFGIGVYLGYTENPELYEPEIIEVLNAWQREGIRSWHAKMREDGRVDAIIGKFEGDDLQPVVKMLLRDGFSFDESEDNFISNAQFMYAMIAINSLPLEYRGPNNILDEWIGYMAQIRNEE